jgi:hypothetical protein
MMSSAPTTMTDLQRLLGGPPTAECSLRGLCLRHSARQTWIACRDGDSADNWDPRFLHGFEGRSVISYLRTLNSLRAVSSKVSVPVGTSARFAGDCVD